MSKVRYALQRWRLPLLGGLLAVSLALSITLALTAPSDIQPQGPFVWLWLSCFLPYALACFLVLWTPAQTGWQRWGELALILGGALLLRIFFLNDSPNLTHDSWRYLWDARVTLHGFSPYVYAPGDSHLTFLRDFLYDHSRYRGVPTIYPPFAQSVYLLSYLIAPEQLPVLKGIFVACDLLTSCVLILLLQRKGQDPARCLIYAWCPLPIVEFALQGHVDVITVLFSVLALYCAQGQWRGARALTGLCITLATLVKIYPIVLLLVMWRRRDWALVGTCFCTIVLAYVPYLLLGHGKVVGFFSTYAGELSENSSPVTLVLHALGTALGLGKTPTSLLVYAGAALVLGSVAWFVFWARQREQLSMEAGSLFLFGAVFMISPHIFPWYTTALLPWVVLLLRPLRGRMTRLDPAALAIGLAWYFPCITITAYFLVGPYLNWSWYYVLAYALVIAGLAYAAILWMKQKNNLKILKEGN